MFSFLKNKSKTEQTKCVVVVTSHKVMGAVVRTYHHEGSVDKPIVLFSCESKIPTYHFHRETPFEQGVVESIKKVLEQCRKVHGNYDNLVCVIGSTWSMAKSRTIMVEKNKPFKVTQKIIDEALARDARLFEQEAFRDYAADEQWGLIHTSHPEITSNGYRVSQPIGITSSSIAIHITATLAPVWMIEAVLGAYTDVFHRTDVQLLGMDILDIAQVRNYARATVLHIDGVTSSLTVVHNGAIEYTKKIKEGIIGIKKDLAVLFDRPQTHIETVLRFVHDEKILDHERDVYVQRIEQAYNAFGAALRIAVLEVKKHVGTLPYPIVITGDPQWIKGLHPLLVRDMDQEQIIKNRDDWDHVLVYTHSAPVRDQELTLAILVK